MVIIHLEYSILIFEVTFTFDESILISRIIMCINVAHRSFFSYFPGPSAASSVITFNVCVCVSVCEKQTLADATRERNRGYDKKYPVHGNTPKSLHRK